MISLVKLLLTEGKILTSGKIYRFVPIEVGLEMLEKGIIPFSSTQNPTQEDIRVSLSIGKPADAPYACAATRGAFDYGNPLLQYVQNENNVFTKKSVRFTIDVSKLGDFDVVELEGAEKYDLSQAYDSGSLGKAIQAIKNHYGEEAATRLDESEVRIYSKSGKDPGIPVSAISEVLIRDVENRTTRKYKAEYDEFKAAYNAEGSPVAGKVRYEVWKSPWDSREGVYDADLPKSSKSFQEYLTVFIPLGELTHIANVIAVASICEKECVSVDSFRDIAYDWAEALVSQQAGQVEESAVSALLNKILKLNKGLEQLVSRNLDYLSGKGGAGLRGKSKSTIVPQLRKFVASLDYSIGYKNIKILQESLNRAAESAWEEMRRIAIQKREKEEQEKREREEREERERKQREKEQAKQQKRLAQTESLIKKYQQLVDRGLYVTMRGYKVPSILDKFRIIGNPNIGVSMQFRRMFLIAPSGKPQSTLESIKLPEFDRQIETGQLRIVDRDEWINLKMKFYRTLSESFDLRAYLQDNWLLQESEQERSVIETTDFSEVVDQVLETPEPFDDACRVAEQYLKIYHKKARQKLTSGDKAFIHTFGTKIDDIDSEVGESFEWKWPECVPRGWDWDRFISELEFCYKKAFEQEFGKWKNLKAVLDGLYTLHTSSGGFGSLTIDDQIFQSILDLGEHFGFEPGQDFSIVTTSPPTFLSVDSQNVEVYYGLPELEGEKAVEALAAAFEAYERDEDVKRVLEKYCSDKVGWTNVSEMSDILKGHVLRDIKSFLKYPDMCQALPCQLHNSL